MAKASPRKRPSTRRTTPTVLLGPEHLEKFQGVEEVGVDIETGMRRGGGPMDGLNPWRGAVAVITYYDEDSNTVIVDHCRGKVSKESKKFLESRKRIVGHNLAGFDLLYLHTHGVHLEHVDVWDTMLSELALLTTDRRDVSVSLKSTVARRTGKKLKKDQDHSGWMNERLTESQMGYVVGDVTELMKTKKEQLARADDDQLMAIEVENALVPIIVKMSTNGVPVDTAKMKAFIGGQAKSFDALSKKLSKDLGPINFGSHVQVRAAFAKLGFELKATGKEVLKDHAMFPGKCGELCKDLLELKHAKQRMNMYKDDWMHEYVIDGLIHPRYWTCSTDTGRMSSSSPNLQQWPRDMRLVVGGVPGHKMVWGDYSQLEIRVAAAVANCPGLKAAFEGGKHIHTDVASIAFKVPYDEVTKDMVKLAKALSFTMLFGGGWETFATYARMAGFPLTRAEAERIIHDFFAAYPGLMRLKDFANKECNKARYGNFPVTLRLPTGLKRHLFGYKASPSRLMNTLIQGGAAAGLKFSMIECHRRGLTEYMVSAVHDELVASVPDKKVHEFKGELDECMKYGMREIMDVPVEVDIKSGNYWVEEEEAA